ncbi:MAG: HDOD domain-containing protein [Kurthia sp.]|nr:HDOD domain-containing protein [Candidatus Kurthia equi]
MEIFIGRQPIFNGMEKLFAYELLYRSGQEDNKYVATDSDMATVEVLINSFFSIGFDELASGKPCFINFTESLIMSDIFESLSPKEIVVEVLEDVPITPQLVKRIQEIKAMGFRIALDDFVMQENVKLYDQLFKFTDFIKVDFLLSTDEERYEIERNIKENYPHITLLAEKVETRAQYLEAQVAGYKLFQGYYFKQPQIIKGNEIPTNLMQYYQIIALLKEENPNIDTLSEEIEHDVSLSFKLLKLINNSSKRTKKKIRSIKQAILLLGLTDLQKWVYILAYRESGRKKDLGIYEELMKTSLVRAKLCELMAKKIGYRNYSEYFLVGMFSLIDSLLEKPMNLILKQLPLSDNVVETISGAKTEMTAILQITIALERLDWEAVEKWQKDIDLKMDEILGFVEVANKWTAHLGLNPV